MIGRERRQGVRHVRERRHVVLRLKEHRDLEDCERDHCGDGDTAPTVRREAAVREGEHERDRQREERRPARRAPQQHPAGTGQRFGIRDQAIVRVRRGEEPEGDIDRVGEQQPADLVRRAVEGNEQPRDRRYRHRSGRCDPPPALRVEEREHDRCREEAERDDGKDASGRRAGVHSFPARLRETARWRPTRRS